MPRILSHLAVSAIYHPPSADDKSMTAHILNSLDTISRDHPLAGVVLIGDFNRLRDSALLSYPLKQVVKSPTRNAAILDKIYTNLQEWYERPVVLPSIGCSDHRAVAMSATFNNKWERGEDVMVVSRSQDSNGKAMLAHAIQNVNWTQMYQLQTCDEMVSYFYNTVVNLIKLPLLTVRRHCRYVEYLSESLTGCSLQP